jgi:hypothetical protein
MKKKQKEERREKIHMRIVYEHAILSVLPSETGRTKALRSTQPLTEISTRNISGGVKAASE